MDTDDLNSKAYLEELYRQTSGDTEVQVSMYDLGETIGLDRAEASILAEQLMFQGQIELKSLAGGISITPEGLAVLGIADPNAHSAENDLRLSDGLVADEADRQTVQLLTESIKNEISGLGLEYSLLEEIVVDLKTIEVHMLSTSPKLAVIREIFRSLQNTLETAKAGKTAAQLKTIIG
jgi:hypothetical protein